MQIYLLLLSCGCIVEHIFMPVMMYCPEGHGHVVVHEAEFSRRLYSYVSNETFPKLIE